MFSLVNVMFMYVHLYFVFLCTCEQSLSENCDVKIDGSTENFIQCDSCALNFFLCLHLEHDTENSLNKSDRENPPWVLGLVSVGYV